MAAKRGASTKVQQATVHESMLTPEARAKRQALEEAKNVDNTGMRRIPGDRVIDRDGRTWTVQSQHKMSKTREAGYGVTPDRAPDLPDFGYVWRHVTDEQLDRRDFGFKKGTRLARINGEFVTITTDFT